MSVGSRPEGLKTRPAPILTRREPKVGEMKTFGNGYEHCLETQQPQLSKKRRCDDDDDEDEGVTESSVGTVGHLASEEDSKEDCPSSSSRLSWTEAETPSESAQPPSSVDITNVAEAMCLLPSGNVNSSKGEENSDVVVETPPSQSVEQPGTAPHATVTNLQESSELNSDQAETLSAKIAAKQEESLAKLRTMVFENRPDFGVDDESQNRFKGCYFVLGGRWESKITFKSKTLHIGTFDTDIEAALAFDIRAHELGVSHRCNFLYDDQGTLTSQNPQGGIRKTRHRNRALKQTVDVRSPQSNNYPYLTMPQALNFAPMHFDHGRGGGVRIPNSAYYGYAPQRCRPPYSWTFNTARRIVPVHDRREALAGYSGPPPPPPHLYHQHHQYGYNGAVGGTSEARGVAPAYGNIPVTETAQPWNSHSYHGAPPPSHGAAAAELSRAAHAEFHGNTKPNEELSDGRFLV